MRKTIFQFMAEGAFQKQQAELSRKLATFNSPRSTGQFGPDDTAEGYRRHRIEVGFRGPDHGSKETMREYDDYG